MQETAGKVMIELKETITPKDEVTQDTPDVVSSSMMPIDKIKSSDYKKSKIEEIKGQEQTYEDWKIITKNEYEEIKQPPKTKLSKEDHHETAKHSVHS